MPRPSFAFLPLKWTVVFLLFTGPLWAQTPTPTLSLTSQLEEKQGEIDELKRENEGLRKAHPVEMPSPTAVPNPLKPGEVFSFQDRQARVGVRLALENKADENLLVLDPANAAIWNRGVRYSLYDFPRLAGDRKWKLEKRLERRDPAGHPRWLYLVHNFSLLGYPNKDRGIVEILSPVGPEDFKIITTGGLSFQSGPEQVRNAYPDPYFKDCGERREKGLEILGFRHGRGFSFDDRLEFFFDAAGRLVKIRLGVLDER